MVEAETARVTLFDGGDIMYGNNVNEPLGSGLDWRGVCWRMLGEGKRAGVVGERRWAGSSVERWCGLAKDGVRWRDRSSRGEEEESDWT